MLDPIQLTQQLIQQNTTNPPGNEKIISDQIIALFDLPSVDILEHYFDDNRTGLIISIEGKKKDASFPPLAFTGHFDTVPLGNVKWSYDPFAAEIIGDRIYGRGSSDMKSGVASFLAAIHNNMDIIKNGYGCVCILTACEELACQGSKKMAIDGVLPHKIGPLIIAEPTGNRIHIGHKGVFWIKLSFKGQAAHGSMPQEGENAIEDAFDFICDIKEKLKHIPSHDDFGHITLNVGSISGGTAINLVADTCILQLDIRLTPNCSEDHMMDLFNETLKKYDADYEILDSGNSIYTPMSEESVQLLSSSAQKVGADDKIYPPLSFFTDGSPILKSSECLAPIVYGPGETHMCHKVDEYASVTKIKQAYDVYTQMIKDYNQS